MAREQEARRSEEAARQKEMQPEERDYAAEQEAAVAAVRAKEARAKAVRAKAAAGEGEGQGDAEAGDDEPRIRQCNEGKWPFTLEDEDGEGNCVLRLSLSRFLDTSLVDADVHPAFVSIVVKGKLFRLLWPEEVESSKARCQRSQTTGELVITVPKVRRNTALARLRKRELEEQRRQQALDAAAAVNGSGGSGRVRRLERPENIGEMLLLDTGSRPLDRQPRPTGQAVSLKLDEEQSSRAGAAAGSTAGSPALSTNGAVLETTTKISRSAIASTAATQKGRGVGREGGGATGALLRAGGKGLDLDAFLDDFPNERSKATVGGESGPIPEAQSILPDNSADYLPDSQGGNMLFRARETTRVHPAQPVDSVASADSAISSPIPAAETDFIDDPNVPPLE
jgi:hypothetical protein